MPNYKISNFPKTSWTLTPASFKICWDEATNWEYMMHETKKTLEQRLEAHPKLRNKLQKMLDLADGQIEKADDAEEQLIGDINDFGNQILQDWAESRAEIATPLKMETEADLIGNGKKTPLVQHLRGSSHSRTDIQVKWPPGQTFQ
jgi:hypothetical protein